MAWTSQGEEMLATLTYYIAQPNQRKKEELRHTYNKAIDPFLGEWTSLNEVTFVNLRNRENMWSNLSLDTLKKAIGFKPQHYCVIYFYNFDFETLLILTLHYLPREKFCMYPEEETLEGPFLHSPWDILGRRICARPSISINCYLAYLAYKVREIAPM